MVYKCTNDEAPSYLACLFDRLSETSTRERRNTETDLRVSRFYEQHVAKNVFLLEGRSYGMALTQNQNYQKVSNNLNPVLKTPEHKGTLSIPADRELLSTFTLLFLSCILWIFKGLSCFSSHRAACKAIYAYIIVALPCVNK